MQVRLNRSVRARRISLRISRNGEVVLTYPWYGRKADALRFLQQKQDWVQAHLQQVAARPAAAPLSEEEQIRAKEYLPQRLSEIAAFCQLSYSRVTIRDMHTRLGSCSRSGHITLASGLIRRPWYLADAVIIHELCHTVHMDHQEGFHQLMEGLCRRWLAVYAQDPEIAALLSEASHSRARYPLSHALRRRQLRVL